MKILLSLLLVILHTFLFSIVIRAAKTDCEVRLFSTTYDVRNGKLIDTDTVIIQINNRKGEDLCAVQIPYSRNSPMAHFSAWIADTNGVLIRQLKKQEYVDKNAVSDGSLYQDYFLRTFTLKHNIYPYRVCYTFQRTSSQFVDMGEWDPVMDADIPTRKARLTLLTSPGYEVNIVENNIHAPSRIKTAAYEQVTWQASYDGMLKREILSPELDNFIPSVRIAPLDFFFGVKGSARTWESYGEWELELMKGLNDLPESEKQEIRQMIEDKHDKKDIISTLYHYLQDHTRYVNVTIGLGGLKPYPASYVAINKYGDCKALSNYMKALLETAGIASLYVDVHAGEKPPEIISSLPSQQFNHVIIAVPLEHDTIWLENTSQVNPFGYAGTSIQNRKAFLMENGNSRLVQIPSLKTDEVLKSLKIDFFPDLVSGNARTIFIATFRGGEFELYNSLMNEYSHEIQNNYIHDHLPFLDFELKNWFLIRHGRDARYIQLKSDLLLKNLVKTLDNERYFGIQPLDIPKFENPKDRKLPVQIPYPLVHVDTLVYHLPSGHGRVICPADTIHENRYGTYHIRYVCDEDILTVYRSFLLYPGNIPTAEYPSLFSFISAIRSEEKRIILIQPI